MKFLFYFLAVFYLLSIGQVNAQITISFQGTDLQEVEVRNLSTGDTVIVSAGDDLVLTGPVAVQELISNSNQIKVYPNPMTEQSTINFLPPVKGNATVSVYNVTGGLIAQYKGNLEKHIQQFKLSGLKTGTYIFKVNGNGYQLTEKILSVGTNVSPSIELLAGNTIKENEKKSLKKATTSVDMDYSDGGVLIYTAMGGVLGNNQTVVADVPTASHTVDFSFTECVDADLNYYPVVQIGTQLWMAENLRTTKYPDGSDIYAIDDRDQWANLGDTAAYTGWWMNSESLDDGAFYTWSAAMNSADSSNNVPSGVQGVCPDGWHLPSEAEFDTLFYYLATNGYNYDGSVYTADSSAEAARSKIAKALGTIPALYDKKTTDNEGAPGNTDYPEFVNRTGFEWAPMGRISSGKGKPLNKREHGYLWSSTGAHFELEYKSADILRKYGAPNGGYSVRCLKD